MPLLRIPDEDKEIRNTGEISSRLAKHGVEYEQWEQTHPALTSATAKELLAAYRKEIDALKLKRGYTKVDIIDVSPRTPNLDMMLSKFSREHWHNEDEVRFVISGRCLVYIRPTKGPIMALEMTSGDLLRVPRETWRWFNLCRERKVRVIRLFKSSSACSPHYTNSGVEEGYDPICLGANYFSEKTI